MTTPQHQLLNGINQLLEIAGNKSLGLVTRLYLADDINTLLREVEQKQEYCLMRHKVPASIYESDPVKALSEIVETDTLAKTYLRLITLHSELRRDAAQIVADSSPEKDEHELFKEEDFLRSRLERIIAIYERAKELNKNPSLPVEFAAGIYAGAGEGDLRVALSEYESGHLASARRFFDKAADSFLKVAEVDINSIWYGKAGLCLLRAQKYEMAISCLTKSDDLYLLEADSVRKVFLSGINSLFFAEAYLKLGKYPEALDKAILCVKANPGYPDGYAVQGDALRKLGRVDEAVQSYGLVLNLMKNMNLNEKYFDDYLLAIRAERGLQKLGKSASTQFEQEAIKEGYPEILEVMKEYD